MASSTVNENESVFPVSIFLNSPEPRGCQRLDLIAHPVRSAGVKLQLGVRVEVWCKEELDSPVLGKLRDALHQVQCQALDWLPLGLLGYLKHQHPKARILLIAHALDVEVLAPASAETQRMLFSPVKDYPDFADFLWADSIPKLLQAKLIESFQNYDIAHAPMFPTDGLNVDDQLLIDVRRFRVTMESEPTAEIAFSASVLDKSRKVIASRLFEQNQKFDKLDPAAAVAAFDDAFGRIAKELISWTVTTL